jgi:hypothetical protein
MASYWVYILSSKSRKLYIGVTSDLVRRVYDHKNGTHSRIYQEVSHPPPGLFRANIQLKSRYRSGKANQSVVQTEEGRFDTRDQLRVAGPGCRLVSALYSRQIQARSLAALGMTASLSDPSRFTDSLPSGGFSRPPITLYAYSPLSTPAGSTRAARRAGIHAAASAVAPSRTTSPAYVMGSEGLMS